MGDGAGQAARRDSDSDHPADQRDPERARKRPADPPGVLGRDLHAVLEPDHPLAGEPQPDQRRHQYGQEHQPSTLTPSERDHQVRQGVIG